MTNITFLIQTAERMVRDNTTAIGAICAEWNRINFEANTGLSFATPTRRAKLIERLEAAIIELNSRDSRIGWDGKDNREFSGNSIAAAHAEAFKMDRERTANQLRGLAQRIVDGHDQRITNHNDLCDLAKAPQHLYAGEDLDLTVEFNRKRFEQLQAQLTDFINTGRAVYSTDKGRHFVQVDSKHLYEFNNEYDAVNYANRINGVQS